MSGEYGVFRDIVTTSGCLLAATGAVALGWKHRSSWEPVEDDIPRAPQKVGALVSALGIGLLWANRDLLGRSKLNQLTLGFGAMCVVALAIYVVLVGTLVYVREVAIAPRETRQIKIIGGFWVHDVIKDELKTRKSRSLQESVKRHRNEPDEVWPRLSRALSKLSFVVAYMALTVGGTIALASVSLLITFVAPQAKSNPPDSRLTAEQPPSATAQLPPPTGIGGSPPATAGDSPSAFGGSAVGGAAVGGAAVGRAAVGGAAVGGAAVGGATVAGAMVRKPLVAIRPKSGQHAVEVESVSVGKGSTLKIGNVKGAGSPSVGVGKVKAGDNSDTSIGEKSE